MEKSRGGIGKTCFFEILYLCPLCKIMRLKTISNIFMTLDTTQKREVYEFVIFKSGMKINIQWIFIMCRAGWLRGISALQMKFSVENFTLFFAEFAEKYMFTLVCHFRISIVKFVCRLNFLKFSSNVTILDEYFSANFKWIRSLMDFPILIFLLNSNAECTISESIWCLEHFPKTDTDSWI